MNFESSNLTTVANNVITNNQVSRLGGGIVFFLSNDITLTMNTIMSNDTLSRDPDAPDYGAGLFFRDSTKAKLIGNIIRNNGPRANFGGGLYAQSSDITMINNIVADNQAELGGVGSGLYIENSSSRLLHNTIARNSGGDNSGLHITGTNSTVAMTNTILVSHMVGITVAPGNTALLNGVLWHNNTTNTDGVGTITVINEHTGDPAFAADEYHLTAGSAAFDRGVPTDVTTDIDGELRPLGPAPDLGADELPLVGLVVTKVADPDPVQTGSLLTYTIRVTNTGYITLTATITDFLPTYLTPVEPLVWPATTIAPNQVLTQSLVVVVGHGHCGSLTNVVQVTTFEGASSTYTATSEAIGDPCFNLYLPIILAKTE